MDLQNIKFRQQAREDRLMVALLVCIVFGLGVHVGGRRGVDAAEEIRVRRPFREEKAIATVKMNKPEFPRTDGVFGKYLATGKRLPVVMLACNRPEAMREALTSLLNAGIEANDVAIAQDGSDRGVRAVADEFGIEIRQNGLQHGNRDGAARIAANYGYALRWAIEERFPDAPGVIVVEDDLLFSPDFADYFTQVAAPLLDSDPSVFVVSAWNDNGFFAEADKHELRRSEWFPGLGWLLPRNLWIHELGPKWPRSHWDHWLRDKRQHKGRDTIFPAVPRTYHNGQKGTFMDSWHHLRYFEPIKHNIDPSFVWRQSDYLQVIRETYENSLRKRISSATHIAAFNDLPTTTTTDTHLQQQPIVFWYGWKPTDQASHFRPPPFVCLAEPFHLWHEFQRTNHFGLHFANFQGRPLLLINAHLSKYAAAKPEHIKPLGLNACPQRSWRDLGRGGRRRRRRRRLLSSEMK